MHFPACAKFKLLSVISQKVNLVRMLDYVLCKLIFILNKFYLFIYVARKFKYQALIAYWLVN